jgi:hypothetical protein
MFTLCEEENINKTRTTRISPLKTGTAVLVVERSIGVAVMALHLRPKICAEELSNFALSLERELRCRRVPGYLQFRFRREPDPTRNLESE